MNSIRARLTMAYAGALLGTMLVFALALWTARRSGATADTERYVSTEANLALNILRQTERAGQPVTLTRDTMVGPVLTNSLKTLLEFVPDYLLVLDKDGRILYLSQTGRALDPDVQLEMMRYVVNLPASTDGAMATIGQRQWLFVVRAPDDTKSAISRVAVASSMRSMDAALRELIETMLVTTPLLLIASIALAYLIAGRAFKPVDRLINEVQAITDGRSLHRRLPADEVGDEIGRLAVTLNEMIERLSKSFSALRRFTADASHELKTPLAVLRADVERAMHPSAARGERMVALEEALQETTRMADLVDSLLTLARADEGRFDLHRERIQLEPLVHEVFETITILGEAAGLTVTMPAPEPSTVLGDYARLRQLFLNLGTNAIKYTPTGGSVEVTLVRHGSTAAFSVRDSGIGISAADLPHIFERFYRADRARSRSAERGGFGLGLAIAQWIAEAHGGSISVRSRLGRGTIFTVTLPTVDDALPREHIDQSETAATGGV